MSLLSRHIFRTFLSSRSFHVSSCLNIDPKTVEEVRIPVPWGHIAGKRWGDKTSQPIIALHGFLDNSASFDKLIPLLDVPCVLALDLAGQGLSSHLPKGISVYYTDFLLQLRYLLRHLYNWEKDIVFLAHSFGSSLAFNYAAIYPDEVSKMVNIDCARYRNASSIDGFVLKTRKSAEGFLKAEQSGDELRHDTFDNCVNHMMKIRESINLGISKESCVVLTKRGSSNLGNGRYYFTHDNRLKNNSFARNTPEYNLALASRLKCKVLNIHSNPGINTDEYALEEEKQLKIMKENCSSLWNLVVDGSHHIHLETPELVAPHINKFLNS